MEPFVRANHVSFINKELKNDIMDTLKELKFAAIKLRGNKILRFRE